MKKFLLTLAAAVMLVMPAAAENWVYVGKSFSFDYYLDMDSIIATAKDSRQAWMKELDVDGSILYRRVRFVSSATSPGRYGIVEFKERRKDGTVSFSRLFGKYERLYMPVDTEDAQAFSTAYAYVWDADVEWDGKTLIP